jgi:replicative DNA helicase
MTLLPEALSYAAAGALIFPLNADKTPQTRNGMKDGSADHDVVSKAWRDDSIIGCRIPEKLVLLDIDPRHGGLTVWNALIEAYGPIPVGRQHHSGRNDGGFHAWFQHPGGDLFIRKLTAWAVRNNVARQLPPVNGREGTYTCGIDILHFGHRYTILPPSPHPETGQPYAWDVEGAPGPMPAFLAELLEPPEPPPSLPPRTLTATSDSDSIADWFSATASWNDILTGWTLTHGDGETDGSKWRHPAASAPYSASIRYGCLFVYSANTVFEETTTGSDTRGYTKFRAMSEMSCGGDLSLAATYARELRGPRDDAWTPAPDVSFNPGNTVDIQPITPNGYADATITAEVEPWPEPIPIGSTTAPAPFPLDAFPSWVADQCAQAAVEMQLTPDLAAQLAITCLSVVTASRLEIQVRGRWVEGTVTYIVTSLPPSAGKSPTLNMMTDVIDTYEESLIEASGKQIADREIERRIREHDRDSLVKKGEESQAKAVSDELLDLPELHTPRLITDDATPEKLAVMMGEQSGRIAVLSAEGGGLFGMILGKYSDGKSNLELYLGAWSRDKYVRDRVVGPPVIIRKAHLTIGLCLQPDVLRSLSSRPELAGRGLTSRFMYSVPAVTVGARDLMRTPTYDDAIEATYNRRILAIATELDHRVPVGSDPVRLTLAPDALHAFLTWQQQREWDRAPGQPLQHMAEWVSKCDSSTVRLAAMLHVADLNDDDTPVSVEIMRRAMLVGDYWTSHATAAFDLMGVDELSIGARVLIDWIAANGADEVSVSELHRSHRRRFPRVADIVETVELLVERGWLRPVDNSALPLRLLVGKPGQQSPKFAVSPSALLPGDDEYGTGPVPLCTSGTTLATLSGRVEGTLPPKVQNYLHDTSRVVPKVTKVLRHNEVLSSSVTTDTEKAPESRTTGTTPEIEPDQPTDTASAIVADPVDNFDPMDLI